VHDWRYYARRVVWICAPCGVELQPCVGCIAVAVCSFEQLECTYGWADTRANSLHSR
jgi:hypothetical protein